MSEQRLRRPRAASDLSVGQLTLVELQEELERRVRNLKCKRLELVEQIEEIDRQLTTVGLEEGESIPAPPPVNGESSSETRRRPRNKMPLRVLLAELLDSGPMTTRELADAALASGYLTTSKNFVNNVGVALHADERFVREDGQWVLAEQQDGISIEIGESL